LADAWIAATALELDDILAKYAANRLRVVRQLRYSLHNEKAIDLVFFSQRHSGRYG